MYKSRPYKLTRYSAAPRPVAVRVLKERSTAFIPVTPLYEVGKRDPVF